MYVESQTTRITARDGILKAFGGAFGRVVYVSNTQVQPEKAVLDLDGTQVNFLDLNQIGPAYSDLTGPYKKMDDHLLIAVAAAEKALEDIPVTERTWRRVLKAFTMCPILAECKEERHVDREASLAIERSNWFKTKPLYSTVVEEVQLWLKKLIVDPDIVEARLEIDLDAVKDIVAHAGGLWNNGSLIYSKERQRRSLLDIGLIRYPDPETPYFKVYRLELAAWCESRSLFAWSSDKNGIEGRFNVRQFSPRDKVIEGLAEELRAESIQMATALLRRGDSARGPRF